MRLEFILAILMATAATGAYASDATSEQGEFRKRLAEFHAPIIVQGIGSRAKSDIFTRVDFDGDLNSDNNWKNVDRMERVGAYVYYDVIESKTHWFLTYSLFFPRDYSWFCFWKHCHENDFEGMRLTVRKTHEREFGEIVLLETLAHDQLKFDSNPVTWSDLTGREPASVAEETSDVVVVVEKGGHGIYSYRQRKPDKKNKVYRYAGDPYADGGYELVPLWELWELRDHVGKGKLYKSTYDYRGRFDLDDVPAQFGGKKWGSGHAKPAFGWAPKLSGLSRGDWFFDPTESLCRTVTCKSTFDRTYVYHPYVGITD